MTIVPEIRKCDRCNRVMEIAGVWSSILGAISFCGCLECLSNRCEPFWLAEYTLLGCEGWNNIAPWFAEIIVYKDGRYQTTKEALPEPTDEQKKAYAATLEASSNLSADQESNNG